MTRAFAVVKEACRRLVGHRWEVVAGPEEWAMIPFDVQLFGATVLHSGKIAEMATGEGKTLVATMPLYLNALPGRGVHLITHNNFLAKRDAMWMGAIYNFLGLSVGVIQDARQTGGAEDSDEGGGLDSELVEHRNQDEDHDQVPNQLGQERFQGFVHARDSIERMAHAAPHPSGNHPADDQQGDGANDIDAVFDDDGDHALDHFTGLFIQGSQFNHISTPQPLGARAPRSFYRGPDRRLPGVHVRFQPRLRARWRRISRSPACPRTV